MKLGDPPFQDPISHLSTGFTSIEWSQFFADVQRLVNGLVQSGTSPQRPTTNLYPGRMYFDTTLGMPIWYKTTSWVKADGTAA